MQDALDIFFQDESIEDFKCEKCGNNKEDIVIHRKFFKLPRILILHLKRYDHLIKREEKLTSINTNDKNTDIACGTESSQTNLASISTTTKKNVSFINIPRFLTLQFLITEKSLLKLPKKISTSNILIAASKKSSEKSTLLEKTDEKPLPQTQILPQKTPLKSNLINIDFKMFSKEVSELSNLLVIPDTQQQRPQATSILKSIASPRMPLASTTLNQQKGSNNFNTSLSNTPNLKSAFTPNSHGKNAQLKELSNDDITDLSFDLDENDPKSFRKIKKTTFSPVALPSHYDRTKYIMNEISEEDQLKLALEMSMQSQGTSDSIKKQLSIYNNEEEQKRRISPRSSPSPLFQLDGNNDDFDSSLPDIVEVPILSDTDNGKKTFDENNDFVMNNKISNHLLIKIE